MSQTTDQPGRTREEKLRALVRKDIDPEITALAKACLERIQEESS